MSDSKTEKWMDRLTLVSGDPPEVLDSGTIYDAGLPDVFCTASPPATDDELALADEALVGLNMFLETVCQVPAVAFSPDRLHFVDEAEFLKSHGGGVKTEVAGRSYFGRVYARRGLARGTTLGLLAHELVHAVGYHWYEVRNGQAARTEYGLRWPRITPRRSGMMLIDPSWNTLLPHFHGLNEMATELSAAVIRQTLAKKTVLLDEEEKTRLSRFLSSPPLVHFADTLIGLMAPSHGGSVGAMRLLMADYLNGTDVFLERLEPLLPGATERLRRTGAQPHELLPAAEELGLVELADHIRPYCPVPEESE